ncbi:calcium/calmodulin-dependent protein kinase type 1D isoform X1 [Larimichthys crocea]|uniref:calcium/calmodulin-dependent protein kinase type 1D isoform X1 n=1 Tax=Larimichthys crocea TaxID=215358 RepID=UPI000F5DFF03|nr:calcium/calmodulin-dependent protein kinase type 1D isoform X1 [Larimichthys crocea]XP_027136929.1 calcium/calmodulin-dependent protein kinase type 1D isoform X1 [Larimichthys crocea]
MGQQQSTLQKKGYTIVGETKNGVIATKDGDKFFIRTIKISTNQALILEIENFKTTSHPHVMSTENSFKDEDQNTYYVVTEYCQGGSLAEKIGEKHLPESEILSWIVEICMALRTIHEKGFLHRDLKPENIFFTEFGTLLLDGFQEIQGKKGNLNTEESGGINYLAPEVLTQGTYDAKSDIWSVGCILYELCTQLLAFSAETPVNLIPKIISGPAPRLPDNYSSELRDLLADMLKKDPNLRPTALEILGRPIALKCLLEKSKMATDHLQTQLEKLRSVADSLERVHQGTTIGSLAGGVIGAAGGITSIVGLILAPFTLGASLIVTGIGVGVGVAGGVTAGASNIKKIVNQSSDRKAIKSIIKEFSEKINAIALWLQEIGNSLQANASHSGDIPNNENNPFTQKNSTRFGSVIGKGIGGISELTRLLRVVNIGKIAAQASRVVRVAEIAGGVLSGLFVAVDIFFIAMDAKEIHQIRQTQADGTPCSEIMKFAQSIRHAAKELQKVLDEFKTVIKDIPFLEDERELQWDPME